MTIALTGPDRGGVPPKREGDGVSVRPAGGGVAPAVSQFAPVSNGGGGSTQLVSDSKGDGTEAAGAVGGAALLGALPVGVPVGVPQVVQCVAPSRRPVPQTAHEAIVSLPQSITNLREVSDRAPPI
jgi:hypothetical protein